MVRTRQTVTSESHVSQMGVATHSRSTLRRALALVAIVSSHSAIARAEEPSPSELPPADPPRYSPSYSPRVEMKSYALPLGLAYLLAPGLALAAGGGLSELEVDDGYAVLGGAVMFTLPAGVHLYNDQTEQAGHSLLTMVGITAGGILVGGILGWVIGSRGCEGNEDSDACNRRLGTTPVGAAIGGTVGYVGHAIWDVAANSAAPKRTATTMGEPLIWVAPNISRREQDGHSGAKLEGLQVGISSSF
jgi:hypothetical protein